MEFYGEWLLVPSNLPFHRVHTGLVDPTVIGDKFKVISDYFITSLSLILSVVRSQPGARVFHRVGQSEFSQHGAQVSSGVGDCCHGRERLRL